MAAVLDRFQKLAGDVEQRNRDFSQTDDQLSRNRFWRMLVTFVSPPLFLIVGYLLGISFAAIFRLPLVVGYSIGLGLGAYTAVWGFSRSFIENDTTQGFISVNQLASLFGLDALVYYGPGKHFCYWWESRSAGSTVNLIESSEAFDVKVQVKDGKVTYKVSCRYRPDIKRMHEYVSGVAGVGSEVVGLLKSVISEMVASMKVTDAAKKYKEINEKLLETFKHGAKPITPFEERFGIIMGDATIEEAATDIEETIKSQAENEMINKLLAKAFGYGLSVKRLMADVGDGKRFTYAQMMEMRSHIMATSQQGLELKQNTNAYNVNLTGDPEMAKAIAGAAAAFTAWSASKNSGNQSQKSKRKGGAQ